MDAEKKVLAFEGRMEMAEALNHLKSIQQGLKGGTLYLQHGAEVLGLEPEGTVRFEVEAKSKKGKQSLKIEIGWKKEPEVEEAPQELLNITTTEPVAEEVEV